MVASQSHEVSIFVRLLALNLYSKGIQYCYPCEMWLRSTCWEDHLIGKFHKKNTDKKKKHKLKHHKIGKKHTKNKDNNKKKHKLEDHKMGRKHNKKNKMKKMRRHSVIHR